MKDILRPVAAGFRGKDARQVGDLVARGHDRRLGAVLADLAQPHGRHESVAQAFPPNRLRHGAALAQVGVEGFARAAVTELALGGDIHLAQVSQVADLGAGRVDVRGGQGARNVRDLEGKAGG